MSDAVANQTTAAEANELFRKAQELATAEKVEEAFEPYLQAAVLGLPPAAFMVSQMYYGGIGAPEDDAKALVWGYYSADKSFGPAKEWIAEAYPEGLPSDADLLNTFKAEAENGVTAAMYLAGLFMENGRGGDIDTAAACTMYTAGAAAGSPDCEAAMADCICRGCGTARDRAKGAEILKSITDRGFVKGSLGYANCLEKGIGVQKDRAAAFELYKKVAEGGCSLAKFHVGRCYIDGIGVEEDRQEALGWFQLSEAAGNAYGTFGIARCTLAGVLGGRATSGGPALLEKAFEGGCPEAGLMLAQLYAKGGRIVQKDPAKAAEWFCKAADCGNVTAEMSAAQMYASGQGVKKDSAKAAMYYRRAGLHGSIEALHEAGNAYLTGSGVKKNEAEGFRLLSLAADDGYMKSAYLVANCYATGKGVAKDRKKAYELHLALAEKGYNRSMLFVGECLYNGDSVQRDVDTAVGWFRKGAEAKNVFCMYWMGDAYDHGYGVPQDSAQAMEWYRKAADMGHVLSQKIIADRENLESPFEGFMKQAESGDAQSMYMIGMCYESGVRVEKDIAKAREWYGKAAELGNDAAKRALELLDSKEESPSE